MNTLGIILLVIGLALGGYAYWQRATDRTSPSGVGNALLTLIGGGAALIGLVIVVVT